MKRYKTIVIASLLTMIFSACSKHVVKDWQATGGSRNDATIELSYNVRLHEVPELDEQQALELSRERCLAWGYKDSQSFGGTKKTCHFYNNFWGCADTTITKTYQCIGTGND